MNLFFMTEIFVFLFKTLIKEVTSKEEFGFNVNIYHDNLMLRTK